jgi:hypothetical protein
MIDPDGYDARAILTLTLVYSGDEFDHVVRSADALLKRHGLSDFSELFRKLVDDANDRR